MKQYIIILANLFLIVSCNNTQLEKLNNSYSFQEIGESLGEDYKDIIKDLKTRLLPEGSTKAQHKSAIIKFVSEIEKYNLLTFPYYTFDNKKFYTDPSEENLSKCMSPQKQLNIIAEHNGKIEYRFIVEKKNGTWNMTQLRQQCENIISWLPDSLYNTGTKNCKIFVFGTQEFVTYKKNGKNMYFRITGTPISAPHLCEYFVNQYNKSLEMDKYIKENTEELNSIPKTTTQD